MAQEIEELKKKKKASQEITFELFLKESAGHQVEHMEKCGQRFEETVSGANHIICKGRTKLQNTLLENSRFGTESKHKVGRC